MVALQLPRGDVVDDRVSENVIIGAVLGNSAAAGTDDHAEFSLVVGGLRGIELTGDGDTGSDYA